MLRGGSAYSGKSYDHMAGGLGYAVTSHDALRVSHPISAKKTDPQKGSGLRQFKRKS